MDQYTAKMAQRVVGRQPARVFANGDDVLITNHVGKERWSLGTIIRRVATRTYIVRIGEREIKRHVDDLIPYHGDRNTSQLESDDTWMYLMGNSTEEFDLTRPQNSESTRRIRKTYPVRN